ncbi:MAG: pentapeptide repeat-containing protein [Deltaproteobacteria bacterium]|nr:pentapeptide repeat-containing protein [Deltaproteobacteria bacterium]
MRISNLLLLTAFFFLYLLFVYMCPTFAQDEPFSEYKPWSSLTEEEKKGLRKRWTKEKVKEVVKALREGKPLPKFVKKIPLSEEDRKSFSFSVFEQNVKNYDLRGISLINEDLQNVKLRFIHLEGAQLIRANLKGADLIGANLEGADLIEANLKRVNLVGANLEGADLRGASLKGAVLAEANLKGTNLFKASFDWTYLWHVNLGEAKNIRYIEWRSRLFKNR